MSYKIIRNTKLRSITINQKVPLSQEMKSENNSLNKLHPTIECKTKLHLAKLFFQS